MPPTLCLDARCGMAPRRCGYPADSIDYGSGWRSYFYLFISPAPAGSLLAAHARAGPAGGSDIPERGVPVPPLHTLPGAAARYGGGSYAAGRVRLSLSLTCRFSNSSRRFMWRQFSRLLIMTAHVWDTPGKGRTRRTMRGSR